MTDEDEGAGKETLPEDEQPISDEGDPEQKPVQTTKDVSKFEPKSTSSKQNLFGSLTKQTKVQVDPGATLAEQNECPIATCLPVLPEANKPYTPFLYTFRVKPKLYQKVMKKVLAKPPPFYLQLDHCIPVIWTIFSQKSKDNLGIAQLQWALHFLQSIRNPEGVHPKDVELCINTIQDYLIDEYAEMSEESVVYGSSHFGDFSPVQENLDISVNYTEMMSNCSPAMLQDRTATMEANMMEELESIKKSLGIDSLNVIDSASKENIFNTLSDLKKEQIEKIQDDLKMLHTVEDMMKTMDQKNFEGYTNENDFFLN